ncbi:SDR family oxidoreductase [Rhodococcus sp. SGAir0479]|uniref:SDR family oxidoreductase n=1 Tax=Rhodococcus sp. SGAir0479 TaxID=2567884 RepID=UPI0010CD1A0A|nr:NAD(P)H-binding protein [Rhodococcus sp. SGAir0479]QCQ91902.1 NAD-dependent epimerase/dehydratase family protein [Rhodococcus sp. SGAir0479]
MTTYLVAGGTGVAGRAVATELVRRGAAVRVLSRRGGTGDGIEHVVGDLLTGVGLAEALDGVDVVVDTTDGKTRRTRAVLTDGAANLLTAAAAAGVARAVLLSIVNVDTARFAYYRAKTEQERLYREAALPTHVVRATQFHEFVPMICAPAAKLGLVPAFTRTRFQSIDTSDVARALADAAGMVRPAAAPTVVAGPEILTMREMAVAWKDATGARGRVTNIRMPGSMGAFWREGRNLVPDNRFGTVTFAQWLARR